MLNRQNERTLADNDNILANSDERSLSERERQILHKIVHLYILKASPVGSRFLSKYIEKEMKLSPATMRNVMSDLEELEYISHPHTSAGRIPTDKGYRFYVNSLQSFEKLNNEELSAVKQTLSQANPDNLLKNASKILGLLSKYLGVVKFPHLRDLIIQKIELIQLSSTRLLVVLALESKQIRTVTLEADCEIDTDDLDALSVYINEKLTAKPLKFIRDNFTDIIRDSDMKNLPLVRLFTESIDRIFATYQTGERVHIAGTPNLLDYPEFDNPERFKGVIELIENEDVIVHLLDNTEYKDGVIISIGAENDNLIMSDYSLIKSTYKMGAATGTIGLIGPKRMNYGKMITIVKYISDYLSKHNEYN